MLKQSHIRIGVHRSVFLGRTICAGLAVGAVFAADPVFGCGGTPPPATCGKSYVLAYSGPSAIVEGGADVLPLETSHFLGLISGPGGGCLGPPYSVTITAQLDAAFGFDGPLSLGTHSINPGLNMVNVDVPIPLAPVGEYNFSLSSTMTGGGGESISQTVTGLVCVVPGVSSTANGPRVPRVSVEPLGPTTQTAHPGDQREFQFRITNNESSFFTGFVSIITKNLAVIPTPEPDDNGPSFDDGVGPYAISDPGDGDAFPISDTAALASGECIPLPDLPHESIPAKIDIPVDLEPFENVVRSVAIRHWPTCADGSCNIVTVKLIEDDKEEVHDCDTMVYYADVNAQPDFLWNDSGRVAEARIGVGTTGTGAGFSGNPSANPSNSWQTVLRVPQGASSILVGGAPPSSVTIFPPFTHVQNERQIRQIVDYSFINPQVQSDTPVRCTYRLRSEPSTTRGEGTTITPTFDMFMIAEGAPSGYEDFHPFGKGRIHIESMSPSISDATFDFMNQLTVVGVTSTFQLARMRVTDFQVTQISDIELEFQVTAIHDGTSPDGEEGPPPPFIGISIFNDLRGVALPEQILPCPEDLDGTGEVGFSDLLILLAAWSDVGVDADFDGGGVGFSDLLILLAAWGPCD